MVRRFIPRLTRCQPKQKQTNLPATRHHRPLEETGILRANDRIEQTPFADQESRTPSPRRSALVSSARWEAERLECDNNIAIEIRMTTTDQNTSPLVVAYRSSAVTLSDLEPAFDRLGNAQPA